MVTRPALAAAALAATFILAAAGPAPAAGEPGSPLARLMRTIGEPVAAPVCDRAAVRDCQADASLFAQFCEGRADRIACIDRTLSELQRCWAATGCF